jgi:hypothetical protein
MCWDRRNSWVSKLIGMVTKYWYVLCEVYDKSEQKAQHQAHTTTHTHPSLFAGSYLVVSHTQEQKYVWTLQWIGASKLSDDSNMCWSHIAWFSWSQDISGKKKLKCAKTLFGGGGGNTFFTDLCFLWRCLGN